MYGLKVMNHTEYQNNCKDMDLESLKYVAKDADAAARTGRDFNPNVGYYEDEVHYCLAEIRRRERLPVLEAQKIELTRQLRLVNREIKRLQE